jgi:glycosyltransferase involved in cell wall biosynthesis
VIRVFYANDPQAADQGGGAEHFRGIYRALAASGLDWRMVAARLQDRPHPRIDYISTGSHFGRWYLALWLWFWRHRAEIGPDDVLHFHRNYAVWPKYLLCPGRGRVVITYHNVSGRVLEGMLGRLAQPVRLAMKLLERKAVHLADRLICVSERDRRELAATVARHPFEHAAVLAAGVDAQGMATIAPVPLSGTTRLLLLGRLEHQKNPLLAVEVLERLVEHHDRSWTLTIAGDGGLREQLHRRIAASPCASRIAHAGLVPHDRVADLIDAHDMLLLTSRYEASPTVVKEALLRQRPVVSTDVGDVAHWIEPGNGLVCQHDADDLAAGILLMADHVAAGGYRRSSRLGNDAEQVLMAPLLDLYRMVQAGA